jgi:hypothetical protein
MIKENKQTDKKKGWRYYEKESSPCYKVAREFTKGIEGQNNSNNNDSKSRKGNDAI